MMASFDSPGFELDAPHQDDMRSRRLFAEDALCEMLAALSAVLRIFGPTFRVVGAFGVCRERHRSHAA